MRILLVSLISISCYSQKLHHQMLSSQGSRSYDSKGLVVLQSIGQESTIGNYSDASLIVEQGFQQSKKMKTKNSTTSAIQTISYPNPFIDTINFKFSSSVQGTIKFTLFDLLGRLIYSEEKLSAEKILTINNLVLAQGEYLVKLTAKNYVYTTNLLKSK